jgi:hypothetical protein
VTGYWEREQGGMCVVYRFDVFPENLIVFLPGHTREAAEIMVFHPPAADVIGNECGYGGSVVSLKV